ncbi:MAG: outer membrane murein-binding lipoprotein Lpp [Paraglaciecola sp.]|jgi:outer membrane murein-binding lipoprotein Lpp
MKPRYSLFFVYLSIFFSSILLLAGCSNDFSAAVRKVTYPPDFKYVTAKELRSNMEQLASQMQLLDSALKQDNSEKTAQQQQVVDALGEIQKIGVGLQAGDAGATHPFLQDMMVDFVDNIRRARNAASMEPPKYYLAGRVSGGCMNCHKVSR